MKQYTVIANNGEIVATGFCQDETYESNVASIKAMHGNDCFHLDDISVPPEKVYFKNGEFIEYPLKPNFGCNFDFESEQWIVDIEKEADISRRQRNALLYQSDWIESAQARLGEAKYNEWQIYRQELRDISNQAGFPLNVVWPVKPE